MAVREELSLTIEIDTGSEAFLNLGKLLDCRKLDEGLKADRSRSLWISEVPRDPSRQVARLVISNGRQLATIDLSTPSRQTPTTPTTFDLLYLP